MRDKELCKNNVTVWKEKTLQVYVRERDAGKSGNRRIKCV